jgi:hypothetical protein
LHELLDVGPKLVAKRHALPAFRVEAALKLGDGAFDFLLQCHLQRDQAA